ncbi:antitoxin Xre/MbcA/ParS toxin-binding domain-containing protein [Rhodococcus sp. NPDC019627]|uniref:antitoxin Xre/MbcA/ParS toxin-binding domain-containing protein n=1 Tax=unclassified Rhodococcus (in: high G+C Gram-positive bacteria) TaxID=192944 RepID=UPI0033F7B290
MATVEARDEAVTAAAAKKAAGRAARASGHGGRSPRVAADDPLSAERVRYLTGAFGGAQLAAIVGVNRSQPSRWIKGVERPGPAAAPLLIDLEHVLARARLVWGETAAHTWLESANAYLDGARPLDVLQLSGPAPVLEALDAQAWGGAA